MFKDIHFRFRGFHGSDGRCHLRIFRRSNDNNLVVLCSQYKNYYGTSITNGLELIAESLFMAIASNRVPGVSLLGAAPALESWHADASTFDRILCKLFPEKYLNRFRDIRLDWFKLFQEAIWLEHYPKDVSLMDFDHSLVLVELDDSGRPHWLGKPSESWILKSIGVPSIQLLPDDKALDLSLLSRDEFISAASDTYSEKLRPKNIYPVYWSHSLVKELPARLSTKRSNLGIAQSADLPEAYVQAAISEILSLRLPAIELFKAEHPISALIGLKTYPKQKAVDFAIFSPEGDLDSVVEVKRTSSKSTDWARLVYDDIARLFLLSANTFCNCYLIVCGNATMIANQLPQWRGFLSGDSDSRDRVFSASILPCSEEYSTKLHSMYIGDGASRFLESSGHGENCVFIWSIAFTAKNLHGHAPYKVEIRSAGG